MAAERCSRCGGALDPRSGVCERCGSTGFDLRVLAVTPVVGALLGALMVVEVRVAAAWLALASLAGFAALVRGRDRAPAALGSIPWLASLGGAVGACLATFFLREGPGASPLRARIWSLTAFQAAAAALGAFLASAR